MKVRFLLPALCLTTCLAVPSLSRATDLVTNGNFDANTPSEGTAPLDWTLTNASSGSDFFVGPGPTFGAVSSPNSANFGATGGIDDQLSQVLATTPGDSYTLDFFLANDDGEGGDDFSASWNGTSVLSLANTGEFDYREYTFTETATSSSTTLAFFGANGPAWYELDNVSVTGASPVPEPSSLLLLGTGLAGLAGMVGRKLKGLKQSA